MSPVHLGDRTTLPSDVGVRWHGRLEVVPMSDALTSEQQEWMRTVKPEDEITEEWQPYFKPGDAALDESEATATASLSDEPSPEANA